MSTPAQPKRRGLALTIIGAVLMVLVAPAAFVIGTVIGVNSAMSVIDEAPAVPARGTVDMAAGQTRDIYAYVGVSDSESGVHVGSSRPDSTECTVRDAAGAEVSVAGADGSSSWTRDHGLYLMVGSFTASSPGKYAVDCGNAKMLLPDGDDASKAGKAALWGVGGGVAAASVLGLLGLIMLIVGIVKLVNSGRERSQFRLQQQAAQWNPGGYGPGRY